MHALRFRSMTLLVLCTLAALVSAQITFSRDWKGGKRAAPEYPVDCGQFTRLCRHFVHELRQAMTSDRLGKKREHDYPSPSYDDEK